MSLPTDKSGNAYCEGDLLLQAGKTVRVNGVDALGGSLDAAIAIQAADVLTVTQTDITISGGELAPAGEGRYRYTRERNDFPAFGLTTVGQFDDPSLGASSGGRMYIYDENGDTVYRSLQNADEYADWFAVAGEWCVGDTDTLADPQPTLTPTPATRSIATSALGGGLSESEIQALIDATEWRYQSIDFNSVFVTAADTKTEYRLIRESGHNFHLPPSDDCVPGVTRFGVSAGIGSGASVTVIADGTDVIEYPVADVGAVSTEAGIQQHGTAEIVYVGGGVWTMRGGGFFEP